MSAAYGPTPWSSSPSPLLSLAGPVELDAHRLGAGPAKETMSQTRAREALNVERVGTEARRKPLLRAGMPIADGRGSGKIVRRGGGAPGRRQPGAAGLRARPPERRPTRLRGANPWSSQRPWCAWEGTIVSPPISRWRRNDAAVTVAPSILVIEESPADFLLLERYLREQGLALECTRVGSEGELDDAIDGP